MTGAHCPRPVVSFAHLRLPKDCLGFRFWGSGFRVWGLGPRVWGFGLRFWALDLGFWALGFGLLGCGFGLGFRVQVRVNKVWSIIDPLPGPHA